MQNRNSSLATVRRDKPTFTTGQNVREGTRVKNGTPKSGNFFSVLIRNASGEALEYRRFGTHARCPLFEFSLMENFFICGKMYSLHAKILPAYFIHLYFYFLLDIQITDSSISKEKVSSDQKTKIIGKGER